MPEVTCKEEDCTRETYCRGVCKKHYDKGRANGSLPRVYVTGISGCLTEECGRPVVARGMCTTHYMRWRNSTPPEAMCSEQGCPKLVYAHQLCRSHFKQLRPNVQSKPCSVPDCDRSVKGRGYCPGHYRRWKAFGDPLGERPAAG